MNEFNTEPHPLHSCMHLETARVPLHWKQQDKLIAQIVASGAGNKTGADDEYCHYRTNGVVYQYSLWGCSRTYDKIMVCMMFVS